MSIASPRIVEALAPQPDYELRISPARYETAEARARAAEWGSSVRPYNMFELWLLDRMAADSIRVERFEEHEAELRSLGAERARTLWIVDQQLAVERLAEGLHKRPAIVARALRGSRHGAEWLRARWEALARPLREGRDWSDDQRSRALDLLGVAEELRDGPNQADHDGPEPARIAARLALAEGQAEALAAASAEGSALYELDAEGYRLAIKGMPAQKDPAVEAVRREAARAQKRVQWAWAQIKGRRADLGEAPCPAAAAIPVPAAPVAEAAEPETEPEPEPTRRGPSPEGVERHMERILALIAADERAAEEKRAAASASPAPGRPESRQERRKRERSDGR